MFCPDPVAITLVWGDFCGFGTLFTSSGLLLSACSCSSSSLSSSEWFSEPLEGSFTRDWRFLDKRIQNCLWPRHVNVLPVLKSYTDSYCSILESDVVGFANLPKFESWATRGMYFYVLMQVQSRSGHKGQSCAIKTRFCCPATQRYWGLLTAYEYWPSSYWTGRCIFTALNWGFFHFHWR